ncbi:hypothetical protein IKE72_00405 [Candidatus Saccharibacteria bacterium]|nr:hypothetical protein [Candidatus Saccharibacteria bacterium]
MARKHSRKTVSDKAKDTPGNKKTEGEKKSLKTWFRNTYKRIQDKRKERYNPHKSFRRSYREDYARVTNVPGVTYHVVSAFRILFQHWKVFLPLLIITTIVYIVLVGMMNQSDYADYQNILDQTSMQVAGGDIGSFAKAGLLLISTVTSGGLSGESSESAIVFAVLIFIVIWLTTIFLIRHIKAGHAVKLRDALYNSMAPFISSLIVLIVAILQCIPLIIFIVVLSAAVQTEFLSTPFYALVFFIFAAVMILLSLYMLSSSLIALVAVSAPGLYPMRALQASSDLMMGRRTRFIIRLIVLFITLAITWVVVMLPMILIDMFFKQWEWAAGIPFVPVCLVVMTCFSGMYATTYLYLYYRWLLNS